jgi:hypothetical protein
MKILSTENNGNNVEWTAAEGRKFVNITKESLNITVKVPKEKYFADVNKKGYADLEQLFCDYSN